MEEKRQASEDKRRASEEKREAVAMQDRRISLMDKRIAYYQRNKDANMAKKLEVEYMDILAVATTSAPPPASTSTVLASSGVPASFGSGGEMDSNRGEASSSGGEVGGNGREVWGNGEVAGGNGSVDESSDIYREAGGEESWPSCLSSEGEWEDGEKYAWRYGRSGWP